MTQDNINTPTAAPVANPAATPISQPAAVQPVKGDAAKVDEKK